MPVLALLFGAAALLLLIGCANVTILLLARGRYRMREMAVRHALGAGRWRLVSLLLAETLLVTLAAAGLALLAVMYALPPLLAVVPGVSLAARGPHRRWTHGHSIRDNRERSGVDDRRLVAGLGRLACTGRCDAHGVSGQGGVQRQAGRVRVSWSPPR